MPLTAHPRLFFTAPELAELRRARSGGLRAVMWRNIQKSAGWCLTRTPRKEWIAPIEPDPIYANLYDRFYAIMHDMAVAEYLAFAHAYSDDDRYFNAAREWALALCRVWVREADGQPEENKAYAVMRLLKGVAVCYDLLYERLAESERRELRDMLLEVGGKYFAWYLKNPGLAAETQEPHHGSVEAASFGIVALALLGDAPQAADWLEPMVRKHTEWLLPNALTASGTHNQTTNFWISIMQYRISFMDALRRVTGRDLFQDYAKFMDGKVALAAAAGPGHGPERLYSETGESWLWGPSFAQIEYAAPVLFFLARQYRRPIYQYLAFWDRVPGAIENTRHQGLTGDQMLFDWGVYAYAWYDPSVAAEVEPNLPRSFRFKDPHENYILETDEAYVRSSFEPGAICAGVIRGALMAHAGGALVFVDFVPTWPPRKPMTELVVSDDGSRAVVHCVAPDDSTFSEQTLALERPSRLTLRRVTDQSVCWWCHASPQRDGNALRWPNGTVLKVTRGEIESLEPLGYTEEKIVGMGKLKLPDPMPTTYPVITARPSDGELRIEVTVPQA